MKGYGGDENTELSFNKMGCQKSIKGEETWHELVYNKEDSVRHHTFVRSSLRLQLPSFLPNIAPASSHEDNFISSHGFLKWYTKVSIFAGKELTAAFFSPLSGPVI